MIPSRAVLRVLKLSPRTTLPSWTVGRTFTTTKSPDPVETSDGAEIPTQESRETREQKESKGESQEKPATEPKVVVFGGNGFVGSRICQQASNMGLRVVSINRSGRPTWIQERWADQVEWVHGDALQPECYEELLRGALGAISCVGAFGSNAKMYKICGEANIRVIETAARVQVPRFAFISVHHETLPGFVKQIGYFRGKIDAEGALRRSFGSGGVALRPFFIHGTRLISNGVGIPLQALGIPLEKLIGFIPNAKQLSSSIPVLGTGLIPPVKVDSVAKAAVTAVTDPSMTAQVLDVWDILKF